MNFDFSNEQKSIKDQARRFLKERCTSEVIRRVLEGEEPFAREIWKTVIELGWTGAAIPETYGGIGLGYLELCVIAEELGRAITPVPFSSSVYLASEAILSAGNEEQKQKYLPKLAAGKMIGTLAIAEGAQPTLGTNIKTVLHGNKVSGAKVPVSDGTVADFAIVATGKEQSNGGGAISLAVVDLKGSGVSRELVRTMDPTRPHAKIVFDGAEAEPLGNSGEGSKILDRVFNRAAVLTAMEQLGGADACLAMAQDYARNRYAFGRPVGSFQAIKHKLADMYIKNELARSNCHYGAWALSSDAPELPTASASARIAATEAFEFAAKENIQTHGGNGFTWEYDCHLYYRRSKLLALSLGGLSAWKSRLIDRLEARSAA